MFIQLVIFLLILVIIGFAITIFLQLKKKAGNGDEKIVAMMERLTQLNEQNKELRQVMDTKLAETHKSTQEQYRATQEQIGQSMKTVQNGLKFQLVYQITRSFIFWVK